MNEGLLILCGVIFMAYTFDFINGFHDAANSIATLVATRVLTPKQAVLWAAFFNFVGVIFFNTTVAKTIGAELISLDLMNPSLIFSALMGAISWGLLTWYFGLPTSMSQSLIGGLVGAALMKYGLSSIKWQGLIKVLLGIFVSPVLGLILGMGVVILLNWCCRRQNKSNVN